MFGFYNRNNKLTMEYKCYSLKCPFIYVNIQPCKVEILPNYGAVLTLELDKV